MSIFKSAFLGDKNMGVQYLSHCMNPQQSRFAMECRKINTSIL